MGVPSVSAPSALVGEGRINVQPNWPFKFYHQPRESGAWSVETEGLEEPTWLPVIKPLIVMPGASGVRTLERGEQGNPERAYMGRQVELANAGAIFLDPRTKVAAELLPDGVAPGSYLRETPTTDGRPFYHDAWTVAEADPLQRGVVRLVFDQGAFNRWRLSLVADGTIPEALDAVIEERVRRAKRKLRSAQVDQNAPADVRTGAMSRHQASLKNLGEARLPKRGNADLTASATAEADEPKPKKRGRAVKASEEEAADGS